MLDVGSTRVGVRGVVMILRLRLRLVLVLVLVLLAMLVEAIQIQIGVTPAIRREVGVHSGRKGEKSWDMRLRRLAVL